MCWGVAGVSGQRPGSLLSILQGTEPPSTAESCLVQLPVPWGWEPDLKEPVVPASRWYRPMVASTVDRILLGTQLCLYPGRLERFNLAHRRASAFVFLFRVLPGALV